MRQGRAAPRRRHLRAAALAGALLLLAGPAVPSGAAAAAKVEPLTDHSVTITVLDVTPSTPAPTAKPANMTVTLSLSNTTDQTLDNLRIDAVRGDPINSQQALDAAIAHPQPPDPQQAAPIAPADGKPVTTVLAAKSSATVTFTATTGTDVTAVGMCLCADAIYPLYFTAHYVGPDGSDTTVGSGQSYVPSFGRSTPQPVRVSWLWPIIDRPHRLAADAVFTDDNLATSVDRGRLERVLSVLEAVAGQVSLTVVIDPELIDELQVMSTGTYEIAAPGKKPQPGTGGPAAAAWLQRLRTALDQHPNLQVEFTPPADPDIESLTRNGLSWNAGLSETAAQRVSTALGGRLLTSRLSWPYNETLSADTLDAIHKYGTSTVVLNDHSFAASTGPQTPDALSSVPGTTGPMLAAVTSSAVQRYVSPVLSLDPAHPGESDLPKLVAEIAVRAAADPANPHYVAITAPRYVDPFVPTAVRAITSTAHTSWSTSVTVLAATQTVHPVDRGDLVPPKAGTSAMPVLTIDTVREVGERLPAITSMLTPPGGQVPADASETMKLLDSLPAAVQRAESASWLSDPVAGVAYTEALGHALDSLEFGVFIVKPSTGTYTLASSNSPLPVAIQNTLDVRVWVRLRISTVNDLPGFTAGDVGVRDIAPNATLTLHVPTNVQRSGRFQVEAQLYTPNQSTLGGALVLSVHSTALGTIGVVITVVAAAVLVLALLVRLIRRLRRRGGPKPSPTEHPEPAVVP